MTTTPDNTVRQAPVPAIRLFPKLTLRRDGQQRIASATARTPRSHMSLFAMSSVVNAVRSLNGGARDSTASVDRLCASNVVDVRASGSYTGGSGSRGGVAGAVDDSDGSATGVTNAIYAIIG